MTGDMLNTVHIQFAHQSALVSMRINMLSTEGDFISRLLCVKYYWRRSNAPENLHRRNSNGTMSILKRHHFQSPSIVVTFQPRSLVSRSHMVNSICLDRTY